MREMHILSEKEISYRRQKYPIGERHILWEKNLFANKTKEKTKILYVLVVSKGFILFDQISSDFIVLEM